MSKKDTQSKAEQPEAEDVVSATNGDESTANALRSRLNELEKLAQDNLDGWQRSRAEFTNFKRRTEAQLTDIRDRAALDTIAKMLPIIDDFERAIDNIPEDLKDHPWVSGTTLIMKKFDKLLEEHNVETVNPVGESFNPHQHEAVGMDNTDEYEAGTVTVTLQKGYVSGERVLRPALVKVAN